MEALTTQYLQIIVCPNFWLLERCIFFLKIFSRPHPYRKYFFTLGNHFFRDLIIVLGEIDTPASVGDTFPSYCHTHRLLQAPRTGWLIDILIDCRGKKLNCFYCKKKGATVGCLDTKCKRNKKKSFNVNSFLYSNFHRFKDKKLFLSL